MGILFLAIYVKKKGWNIIAENLKKNQYFDGQKAKGCYGKALGDDDNIGGT